MMKRPLRWAATLLLALGLLHPALVLSQSKDEDSGVVRLRYATILVRDYDEALRWYMDVLGLVKIEEGTFGPGHRWLVVAPPGEKQFGIVLAIAQPTSATDPVHNYPDRVGKETKWVFEVKDCRKFYERNSKRGVKFLLPPADQPWGVTQAMFEDLYGNVFVAESRLPAPAGAKQ